MNLKDKVESRLNKSKNKDMVTTFSYVLCKTFGWDYWTLVKQPLPFIWMLLDQIDKENKLQEKELKKGKR